MSGFVGMIVIGACGSSEPVLIDGSSQQAFEKSAQAARRDIPDADRLIFDRAIRSISGRRHANRDPQALARLTFDGMTAEQVVADQEARE
ncbi:MAG: DUF6694 family lipoprotein [Sphingomicrobium sp.]